MLNWRVDREADGRSLLNSRTVTGTKGSNPLLSASIPPLIGRMPYKDPEKAKAAKRRHYLKNKAQYIERATSNRITRRRALGKYVQEVKKDKSCADCKIQYHYAAMEFDHVRGTKIKCIANLVHEVVPLQELIDEMAKCDLVCANCHRVRTWTRLGIVSI